MASREFLEKRVAGKEAEIKMKKYDVTYLDGKRCKVARVYANRTEEEIIEWFKNNAGATSVAIREADTSDEKSGAQIVRL